MQEPIINLHEDGRVTKGGKLIGYHKANLKNLLIYDGAATMWEKVLPFLQKQNLYEPKTLT